MWSQVIACVCSQVLYAQVCFHGSVRHLCFTSGLRNFPLSHHGRQQTESGKRACRQLWAVAWEHMPAIIWYSNGRSCFPFLSFPHVQHDSTPYWNAKCEQISRMTANLIAKCHVANFSLLIGFLTPLYVLLSLIDWNFRCSLMRSSENRRALTRVTASGSGASSVSQVRDELTEVRIRYQRVRVK